MPKTGTGTRTLILDTAEQLYLERGYGGTSIDAVLERTGLTKGAFFHHFASKVALARALIERYAAVDRELLERSIERAERLSRDPLQQALLLVGLYEESIEALAEPPTGCLFASYAYEAGLFDGGIHDVIRGALLHWREAVGAKLRQAMAAHPPRITVSADDLADMFLGVIEGGFVLSRGLQESGMMAKQLAQYRNYLELLFGAA
jgi:TetR/AcrR family transcriptional repressor of nem operon